MTYAIAIIILLYARVRQARRDRERDEGMRRHVARKYPGVR